MTKLLTTTYSLAPDKPATLRSLRLAVLREWRHDPSRVVTSFFLLSGPTGLETGPALRGFPT
jgi:hypothetical protein